MKLSGNQWSGCSKKEIIESFNIKNSQLDPYEIIYGYYHDEDYSGSCFVLLQEKSSGNLFEVNGSHCSCYGLENQWELEATTIESILHRLKQGHINGLSSEKDCGFILSLIEKKDLNDNLNVDIEIIKNTKKKKI